MLISLRSALVVALAPLEPWDVPAAIGAAQP
jgi:hypothetical protein